MKKIAFTFLMLLMILSSLSFAENDNNKYEYAQIKGVVSLIARLTGEAPASVKHRSVAIVTDDKETYLILGSLASELKEKEGSRVAVSGYVIKDYFFYEGKFRPRMNIISIDEIDGNQTSITIDKEPK